MRQLHYTSEEYRGIKKQIKEKYPQLLKENHAELRTKLMKNINILYKKNDRSKFVMNSYEINSG